MRILYIDVNCKKSSTGKIVYDLYTQNQEHGHDAAICYGRGPVIQEANIFKFGYDWETWLHAFLTRLTGWTGCFSFFSTQRLIRFIASYKPDIVHIHELHAYFVNLKPLLQYLAEQNIPVVQTLHCEFTYTGKCGHSLECDRWKESCGACPNLRDYPKTLLFDHTSEMRKEKAILYNNIENLVITTPSAWLESRVRQSFLKDRKTQVVFNGIDTDIIFHPQPCKHLRQQYKIAENEKVVLAVAPNIMSDAKGGKYILEMANTMAHENIRFIMVGVEDLTQQFPPNVVAIGAVTDQKELASYYTLADCFVICSKRETFSMTCAESICCETPVAGFYSGAPETIFPYPLARFVPYGDVNALATAVRTQLSENFAEDQWKIQRARFSKQTMYQQYLDIYRSMLEDIGS